MSLTVLSFFVSSILCPWGINRFSIYNSLPISAQKESMTSSHVTTALPKLPGFSFPGLNQPATFNKTQIFSYYGGIPAVKTVVAGLQPVGVDPGTTGCGYSEQAILAKHPQWKTLSDKALRFFGYFTERVDESRYEKSRVRKVYLTLYLSDGTVSVTETAAVPNSGLRQGTIMSRHKEDGVDATTLAIGSSVAMRARVIHIVDCDGGTRQFYETMGAPQGEALDYPPDTFETLTSKPPQTRDADHIQMKRNVEMMAAAASGNQASLLTPEEREHAKNFLLHDREVLGFQATWDGRKFRINYYIADGTISVINDHAPNNGRDPNGCFIKKARIPQGHVLHKAIDTINAPRNRDVAYLADIDFTTGSYVSIFEREFFVYDCDAYTRQYFAEKYGIDQATYDKGPTEGDRTSKFKPMAEPPATGYGSDEDSLQSFRSIVLKAPRKDVAKYIRFRNDVLRFSAVHAHPKPEDSGRQFIVCFYLADDTVSIYEPAQRNSGHIGGKIFARAPVKGITAERLEVGTTIVLGGQEYSLLDTDERTQKFMQTGVSQGSANSPAEELVLRLRNSILQRFARVTEAYRHFCGGKNGITAKDLPLMFKECEVSVADPRVYESFMELVDKDRDGAISVHEFIENVLGQHVVSTATSGTQSSESASRSYAALQDERAKADFGEKVLELFITKLEARRAFIVDTFRIVSDRSFDGLIGVDAFRSVVQTKLGLNLQPDELDALVHRFFFVQGIPDYLSRRLSLREFRRVVEA